MRTVRLRRKHPPTHSKLGPPEHPQLAAFIEQERHKAVFNELVAKLTDVCWDKCVGAPSTRLSGSEQSCLGNCASRFLDASQVVMNKFTKGA